MSTPTVMSNRVSKPLERGAAFRTALVALVFAQGLLLVAALLAAFVSPSDSTAPALQSANPALALVGKLCRWDVDHYLQLAQGGYGGPSVNNAPLAAYFPLLPALIGATRLLFGLSSLGAISVAGLLVTQLLALVALWLLAKLAAMDGLDAQGRQRAVLYTMLFPLGLFYLIPYTEALFLAVSVAMFVAARQGRWLVAGGCVALATATRITGMLLLVPLLVEMVMAYRARRFGPSDWWRAGLALLLGPMGLLVFMFVLWQVAGNPLAFVQAQRFWGRETLLPPLTLLRGLGYALNPAWSAHPEIYLHGLLHSLIVVVFLGVSIASLRRWPPSYSVYAVLLFALALLSPLPGEQTMQSVGRYVMVLFPVTLTLARWGVQPRLHQALILGGGSLFVLVAALHIGGFFVG